jgi:hypothetical protein
MKTKNLFRQLIKNRVNKRITTAILIAFISISNVVNAQIVLEEHQNMQMDGLRFWYSDSSKPAYIFNRNIAVHGDCFEVINGYAFFTWFKGGMENRNLMLSRKKLGTDKWLTIQFSDKSTLYSGDYHATDKTGAGDSHRTAAVGVSPIDGTIHLAYDMHTGPLQYRVSAKNIAFGDDADFTLENFSEMRNYFRPDLPIPSFTYPSFVNNNAGELIVEYRLGTSRQGDKYITYYDGNSWSDLILLVKGDNENPQFNQYGDLSYHFGKMYLACCVREYGSNIEYNQGFYFAEAGQRGNEDWKNLAGETFSLPIRGLTQFNKFKIAEPLPDGHKGMTSGPEMVVSKNGAVHFSNLVSGLGTVHYYTKVGSKTLIKASGSTPSTDFGGNDGRVYGIDLSSGKIRVRSTLEGTSNWRTDYVWNGSERFGLIKYVYTNGKIYIVASEDVDSDKIPLHFIVLNIEHDDGDFSLNSIELPANKKLLIYPNPTNGLIFFSEQTPWSIFNANGKLIKYGEGTQANIEEVHAGIYLFKTENMCYRVVKK